MTNNVGTSGFFYPQKYDSYKKYKNDNSYKYEE